MEKTTMKLTKMTIVTIVLSLTLTFSATFVALPFVSAHDPPWTISTWCFVNVRNNPIGVNQEQLITFWLHDYPPTADGSYGDRWTFTVDVTKPDGSTDTLGTFTTDNVGGGYTVYTPTQVGTYTVVSKFQEHTITGIPIFPGKTIDTIRGAASVNDIYLASTSDPVTFTVQEEPIEAWPENPLPTEYWTRPINMANRGWYPLAGNWLAGAAQNVGPTERFAYGPAPESAHIMWTKQYWAGGVMDERFGVIGYQTAHYGGLTLTPPIILNGKLYWSTQGTGHTRSGYSCVDLFTGETLSLNEDVTLSFGSIYNYESPNQHGGLPYLWRTSGVTLPEGYISVSGTSTWEMLDGYTGNSITKIANVSAPRGSVNVYGKDGSILYYNIAKGRLTCWNSSAMLSMLSGTSGTALWQWRPQRLEVHNGNTAWSLNVSIPDVTGSILEVREGEYVIGGTTTGYNDDRGVVQNTMWALSLKPGEEGTLLWNYSYTPPQAAAVPGVGVNTYRGMRYDDISPEDGIFIFREQLTRKYCGLSLETGEQLWESEPESNMQFYGLSTAKCSNIYQGKFFSYGYGGEVTAYNITTGEILWKYIAKNVGFESPFGNYPIGIAAIADGKLYTTTSEHSVTSPLFRGSYIRCIDAETGTELWKVLHWSDGTPGVSGRGVFIADGFIVSLNFYDNQIYCYGKGPTATTVTAPDTFQTLGTPILIKGTVMDQSSGTKQNEQAARFPNGVPAVADEYQEDWMEYVYMQQAYPKDAEGVEVVLTTLDPNGNTYEIGKATSSLSGSYGCAFTPEVPGVYKIIATFEGSASYYRSYAETYINVGEAPSPAQPIEPEQPEPTTPEPTTPDVTEPEPTTPDATEPETTEPEPTEPAKAPLITTEVAILAAVAVAVVIGIASYWSLRKQRK